MHFETYDELQEHDERICWTDFTNKYLARLSEEDRYMYSGSGNLEEDLEKEFEEKMAQLDEKHAELEKEELYRKELEEEYEMEKKAEKAIDRYRNQY
jgi:hypothetical protein